MTKEKETFLKSFSKHIVVLVIVVILRMLAKFFVKDHVKTNTVLP